MRSYIIPTILTLLICSTGITHAASKKAPAKVNINYSGGGVGHFVEKYAEYGNGVCAVVTRTSDEIVTDVNWLVDWKNIKPAVGSNPKPIQAFFAGNNSRLDSDDCGGPEFICISVFTLFDGVLPGMTIAKSGKSYILTLLGEQLIRAPGLSTSAACMQSSVFDNAITEGMNSINVTTIKVKITPTAKKKKTILPFTMTKNFDCTDPAKTAAFVSNSCTIMTSFEGIVTITGKWKARLVG